MFGNFSYEAKKVLIDAKGEMHDLKHPYVGSEHLVLAILKSNNDVTLKLNELGINYKKFKDELVDIIGAGTIANEYLLYTPLLRRIIENATLDARETNSEVTINVLFSNLLEEGEGVALRILIGMNIDLDKLYSEFSYKVVKNKKSKGKKLITDEVGRDLTNEAKLNMLDPCISRNNEINRLIEILLRKNKNNPILIGEAGVGKTAIVEGLAYKIANNDIPLTLKNKRIISIDMASLVAGTKYRGEFEEKIRKLLNEVEDNNDIILFIDEIHTIVGAGGAEGAIDASNIFKPSLARGKIKIIGATTTLEYKKSIETDKALDRRFQKIIIKEPNDNELKNIMYNIKNVYEKYHNVEIDNDMIDNIIKYSNRYIFDRYNPDKCIDILDEVCAYVSLKENKNVIEYNKYNNKLKDIIDNKNNAIKNNNYKEALNLKCEENKVVSNLNNIELKINHKIKKKVLLDDIIKVISDKSNVPINSIKKDNEKIINDIYKSIKNEIIGQDEAINKLINVVKKLKLGYKDKVYSLAFIGPSGVGKTYMAKMLSKGLNNNLIRLDMSEYSEEFSISKIIGSPAGYVGYNDNLNILEQVRNNPYSVILLDEVEKAHSNIINLFYQILDEGVIKDSVGRIINFSNTIIIMTSNVGYERETIGFTNTTNDTIKDNFSNSFINRIDSVIYFNYLKDSDIDIIIKNMINKLRHKYNNKRLYIKKESIEDIKKKSEYRVFGARKLEKLIKEEIEDSIIDNIINNQNKLVKQN